MTETREEDAEGRGGKKREQGGRSFREDSHAHHYFNIRPHVGDDSTVPAISGMTEFQSTSPRGGRLPSCHLNGDNVDFNPRPHVGDDMQSRNA